jgi:hypothetical protein
MYFPLLIFFGTVVLARVMPLSVWLLMLLVTVLVLAVWGVTRVLRSELPKAWAALKPVPKAELSPSARRVVDRIRLRS